jgi:uncharacterized membrane protein YgdD (TMEM256/DUF423 family)
LQSFVRVSVNKVMRLLSLTSYRPSTYSPLTLTLIAIGARSLVLGVGPKMLMGPATPLGGLMIIGGWLSLLLGK